MCSLCYLIAAIKKQQVQVELIQKESSDQGLKLKEFIMLAILISDLIPV